MPNTASITLGGKEIELRASNWAAQVYEETFYGQERREYDGVLEHDITRVHARCFKGPDENGLYDIDLIPPFEFWGIVWALAYAAGSTKAGYAQWVKSKRNELWTAEEKGAALTEVIALIEESFFRTSTESEGEEPESE